MTETFTIRRGGGILFVNEEAALWRAKSLSGASGARYSVYPHPEGFLVVRGTLPRGASPQPIDEFVEGKMARYTLGPRRRPKD